MGFRGRRLRLLRAFLFHHLPRLSAAAGKIDEADLSQVSADDRWQYSPEGRAAKLQDLRAQEQTELTTYGWIDQKAGVVRLPIDRAMELTMQSLQSRK